MNNVNYVIVVQVDHVRAQKAYAKGLSDFDLAAPEIIALAEARDQWQKERYERAMAIHKEVYDDYKVKFEAEKVKIEEWRASIRAREEWESSGKWRNIPRVLPQPIPKFSMGYAPPAPSRGNWPQNCAARHRDIRQGLVNKLSLAGAAMQPFNMTEHDVMFMVSLEDGSYVAKLKNNLQSKEFM